MNKILFAIIFVLILLIELSAGPLLVMDSFSAKSFGLGHSDAALRGDIDTFLVNPAGIASLPRIWISGMYLPWYEEISSFSFTFGIPIFLNKKSYGALIWIKM